MRNLVNEDSVFASRRVRLKAILRTTFAALSVWCGAAFVWRMLFARHGVRILAYHGVETPPQSPFSVSAENFDAQIAYVKRHFDVIDLATFMKWRAGEYHTPREKVVLTFDDGFKNNLLIAAPILRKHDVPAVFFVIGSKIDGRDPRFMTIEDLKSLRAAGRFEIGSHTLNHLSVARISDDQCEFEISSSRAVLEKSTDQQVEYFCYPYGTFNDFDDRSIGLLRRSGYKLAFTAVNGVSFRGSDPYRLRRTKVEWSDDRHTFKRLLNGGFDGWIFVDYFFSFLQRPRAVRFDLEASQNS